MKKYEPPPQQSDVVDIVSEDEAVAAQQEEQRRLNELKDGVKSGKFVEKYLTDADGKEIGYQIKDPNIQDPVNSILYWKEKGMEQKLRGYHTKIEEGAKRLEQQYEETEH